MITSERAEQLLKETNGKIFTVVFRKRSNGQFRKMNCRLGVKKHLKGGKLGYDANEKRLLTVFDLQKGQYRCIALDALVLIRVNGIKHRVSGK